jgi:hypothetical protein
MRGGFFAVLDDIAVLADDVAVMGKVAAKKTAGILGDDLAVNAEKATGFSASRELPVLWAITKGSFINKLIILPLAFLLSAYAPWLIVPVLLAGGTYLCYEGVEKIFHTLTHRKRTMPAAEKVEKKEELLRIEEAKIKSAVRTDFILSIEIVVIALGSLMNKPLLLQCIVVGLIALLATVCVYGLVGLMIRMDDAGLYLIELAGRLKGIYATVLRLAGSLLVASLPHLIRALGVIGTVAMLLVGGGIFTHNIAALHHAAFQPALVADLLVGLVTGSAILLFQQLIVRLRPGRMN